MRIMLSNITQLHFYFLRGEKTEKKNIYSDIIPINFLMVNMIFDRC